MATLNDHADLELFEGEDRSLTVTIRADLASRLADRAEEERVHVNRLIVSLFHAKAASLLDAPGVNPPLAGWLEGFSQDQYHGELVLRHLRLPERLYRSIERAAESIKVADADGRRRIFNRIFGNALCALVDDRWQEEQARAAAIAS